MNIEQFINDIIPGNYFLTKSMEITKLKTSGTLWYLKKFLVLYNGVFLTKSVRTSEGIKNIINTFEVYINSLPLAQQHDAEQFFFPKDIDIRKDYKNYYEFYGKVEFNEDIDSYSARVDKYYFMYLMNIGGQSGVKAYIKEKLYSSDFEVKYLPFVIKEYMDLHPDENINIYEIINDYPATIRNERKILFYYGFVHSRSNGSMDEHEFASLTPIGELAIIANSQEFLLIWEHQKIKMISQPVTINFPSIRNCIYCNASKFKLNYSPYFSILKFLDVNENIKPKFYDFVLSRSNNDTIDFIINNYSDLFDNLNKIEQKVKNFEIRSDYEGEDFGKEIKKYLLGVRSDLPKDKGLNLMSYIRFNNGIWEVENKENLHRTIKIYSELEKYKRKRYNKLFLECEEELRKKYEIESQGNQTLYKVNPKTKIKWDLYNIQKDKIIIIGLIINIFTIQKDCELETIKIEDIVNYANKDFKNILKSININSKKEVKESLKGILDLILLDSLENIDYNENFRIDEYYINEYTTLNSTDLMEKIKRVSEDNIKPKLERKRDRQIIGLINAYYLAEYSDENKLVKCECCGATTFLKPNNEPYLEYHHLIPFNIADGPDHYENIVGICPMCHTKIHYAIDSEKIMVYKEFNSNNHLHEDLFTRMKKLYKINVLKSYQLEYALVENMINEEEYQKILS